MEKNKVKVNLHMLMVIFIKDNGKMINKMATALFYLIIYNANSSVNLSMDNYKVK
jgi:hypothetical protein